jgi:hypothetical protein
MSKKLHIHTHTHLQRYDEKSRPTQDTKGTKLKHNHVQNGNEDEDTPWSSDVNTPSTNKNIVATQEHNSPKESC